MFPRLLELGPVTLHSYGLLLATAYLVAITVAARLAASDNVPSNRIWDIGFISILSALIGAKVLLILTDPGGYLARPSRLISLEFWQSFTVDSLEPSSAVPYTCGKPPN